MITDKINHPFHYTSHPSGVECIQITEHFSFNIGNAIKYLWRADEKGAPLDDLKKAGWYIEREITRRINEANTITEIEFPKPTENPLMDPRLLNLRALLIAARNGDQMARSLADDIVENLERGSLDRQRPKNLVTKSASSADARRQYEMGNMAYSGDGMPQDIDHAKEWWTLAAAQGNLDAQKALDACTPPAAEIDARLADIRRQAAGGDRSAQQYLSDCYRHGWYGLIVSPELATMWRNRANEPRTEDEAQKAIDGDALGIDAYSFLVAKSASSPNPTPTQPQ